MTTTTTTTHGRTTGTDHTPGRGRRLIRFGVAAGAALAIATIGVVVTHDAERPSQPAVHQRDAGTLAEIAEMARAKGLTGLSPASLSAIDRITGFEAHRAEVQAAVAAYAVAEGLTGLSPASLRPVAD